MGKWRKRLGNTHLMNGIITRCGLPMLGNNYAISNDSINCPKCIRFRNLDNITTNSVTSYYSALFREATLMLCDMSEEELEKLLEYERRI